MKLTSYILIIVFSFITISTQAEEPSFNYNPMNVDWESIELTEKATLTRLYVQKFYLEQLMLAFKAGEKVSDFNDFIEGTVVDNYPELDITTAHRAALVSVETIMAYQILAKPITKATKSFWNKTRAKLTSAPSLKQIENLFALSIDDKIERAQIDEFWTGDSSDRQRSIKTFRKQIKGARIKSKFIHNIEQLTHSVINAGKIGFSATSRALVIPSVLIFTIGTTEAGFVKILLPETFKSQMVFFEDILNETDKQIEILKK